MSKIEMGACGFEEMALNGKFLEWESGHLFILLSAPGDFTTCCDITAMLLPENLLYIGKQSKCYNTSNLNSRIL